jgi:hypothetical protein
LSCAAWEEPPLELEDCWELPPLLVWEEVVPRPLMVDYVFTDSSKIGMTSTASKEKREEKKKKREDTRGASGPLLMFSLTCTN